MAYRNVNANSITFTGQNTFATELASLRSAVTVGGVIYANDLNRIATLINNMNGHYHNYTDMYQTATYGNNGDRNTYTESKNTAGPDQTYPAPTDTAAGSAISASRHESLRTSLNILYNHYHAINDRTA